jgi:hypothetical protein
MKIRTGFVSNSSSSSFVLRGIKIETKFLAEKLGVKVKEEDDDKGALYQEIEYVIDDKIKDFEIYPTGNYFGGKDYDSVIIGISAGDLEDGEVTEFAANPETDERILKELAKYDIEVKDGLKLYVQYISNDNY